MTTTPETPYPALYTLAQIYFEEDWPDFYDSNPMKAVEAFAREDPELRGELVREIHEVLEANDTEELLKQLFVELDLLYDPPEMGDQTYRGWLEQVAARVQEVLNERD